MSRATTRIGLGATLSSTFYPPYHIARSLGTLDLMSRGRVAWNVVASHGHLEAQNYGLDQLPARDTRYDYADEVVEAVCKLWESWDADALVLDKQRGVYADPDKVHYANYQGKWIKTRGPLTVPRSPQGRPVIMQAGSSPRGRDFAARWGELVFTLQHSKADMQTFYQDLQARVVAQGRAPEDCLILPSIDVIIGETDAIACERQAFVNDLVQTDVGLAQMSGHIGVDLSRYPSDQPLADMQMETGSRGSLDVILQATEAHGLTLGEAARRYATSELCPQIVGSPETVADQLQDLFEARACDGFILTPTLMPGMFEQFVRAVVPLLQARGIFRNDYTGTTLREHLRE
jgi:FMN-dependent oxidoreductase (nitrilotriacetate monooxygenase family)